MKETVNANIGSLAFTLDEDAYRKLKTYLDAVRRHLPADDNDTLGDIERRIAELLREKLSSPLRVVTLEEVDMAMRRMGSPADFGADRTAEGAAENAEPAGAGADAGSTRTRICRSRTNRSIAGICGGLAEYFRADPTLVRLLTLFLILFGGLSIWAYIICWIVIPEEPVKTFKIQ